MESYHQVDGKQKCRTLLQLDRCKRLLEEVSDEEVSIEVTVGEEFAKGRVEAVVEIVLEFIKHFIAMEKIAKLKKLVKSRS